VILLLIALNTTPLIHSRVPCWIVKAYHSALGPEGAMQKGRALGYTDAEMDAIKKRCQLVAPKQSEGGIK